MDFSEYKIDFASENKEISQYNSESHVAVDTRSTLSITGMVKATALEGKDNGQDTMSPTDPSATRVSKATMHELDAESEICNTKAIPRVEGGDSIRKWKQKAREMKKEDEKAESTLGLDSKRKQPEIETLTSIAQEDRVKRSMSLGKNTCHLALAEVVPVIPEKSILR